MQFTEIFDTVPPLVEVKSGDCPQEPFTGSLNSDEADSHANLNTNMVTEERLSKLPGSTVHGNQLADDKVVCHLVQSREPIACEVFEQKMKKL